MNEWRTRPLQSVYTFVYLDCMHYKVKENGCVVTRAIYNVFRRRYIGQEGFNRYVHLRNRGL